MMNHMINVYLMLRSCQTTLASNYTILYCCWQCTKSLVHLPTSQLLILPFNFFFLIIHSIRYTEVLSLALINISLINDDKSIFMHIFFTHLSSFVECPNIFHYFLYTIIDICLNKFSDMHLKIFFYYMTLFIFNDVLQTNLFLLLWGSTWFCYYIICPIKKLFANQLKRLSLMY